MQNACRTASRAAHRRALVGAEQRIAPLTLQATAGSSEDQGGGEGDDGPAGGHARKEVAATQAPPPPKPTLREFLEKLRKRDADKNLTLPQEGPPLFTQMLLPTADSEGYKGVLDALRPIEEQPRLQLQPNDSAHSLKARLLEEMQTEQDAVRQLDASVGQKLMRLADLYRCLKSVADEEHTTGYGQVLMEHEIGHEPQRVAKLAVKDDPTDQCGEQPRVAQCALPRPPFRAHPRAPWFP
jgi:hypothetical protein